MRILPDVYGDTFAADGTFLGGPMAVRAFPPEGEFWHDDAIWRVDRITKYLDGILIFYCVRVRTQLLDFI